MFWKTVEVQYMYNKDHKHDPKSPDFTRVVQPSPASLATTLMIMATMALAPCLGQTSTTDTAASNTAKSDLLHILSTKDAAVESADDQYAQDIDAAERSYEQTLSKARSAWTEMVAEAKTAAVKELKILSSRLAADGQLTETVEVLKAIYALTPQDKEAVEALAATGVDLKSIATEDDYFARLDSRQASRIVIWNTHNSRFNTSGTLQCNVVLFQAGRPVWRSNRVDLPWKQDNDTFAIVDVPSTEFDTVRVEIVQWHGYAGGLAEIEIWQEGKNIALHRPTRASAAVDRQTTSARVTDGITTSATYKDGYWLLPDNQAGWIEISLARPAYQKLLRAKVSAREPWQKVLKVAPGDIIDITADGKWWASTQILAEPDGGLGPGKDKWGSYRDRFYLQGRLDGTVFKIGSQFTLRVPKAGELELGMNEENVDWFVNNSGFLDVVLSIRKGSPLLESNSAPASIIATNANGDADAIR